MRRLLSLLLLFGCSCTPSVDMADAVFDMSSVPPLCFEEPQCGDAICVIGASSPSSTPETALADAQRRAVQALAEFAGPDLGFPAACFDCGEAAKMPHALKKRVGSLLTPQTRYTDRAVYESMTSIGKGYIACVQAEVSQEEMAQALVSIDSQEIRHAIQNRRDPKFY